MQRLDHLTALLDRPALLDALPSFEALQTALGLPPPVDTELRVALETLARVAAVGSEAAAFVRSLQAEGYHFTFPDLDLLVAASRDAHIESMLTGSAEGLRSTIGRALRRRAHVRRKTTNLPEGPKNLVIFSRVDLVRIALLLESLGSAETRRCMAEWVEEARGQGPELGGVVVWDGKVRWHRLASASSEQGRYRRPGQPRFAVELVEFHLHATAGDDRGAAGPSLMDAFGAAFDGRPRLVVTDLGAGRFDVDYYRDAHALGRDEAVPGRLKTVALDLGVFESPEVRSPGAPERAGRDTGGASPCISNGAQRP